MNLNTSSFFSVPSRIPSLTCLYSIEGEGKNIIICGIETYHSMFEISLRIILISLIDFLYIIFQIKLIYLERVLNHIFISCLKIAITLSCVSFIHSFIHSTNIIRLLYGRSGEWAGFEVVKETKSLTSRNPRSPLQSSISCHDTEGRNGSVPVPEGHLLWPFPSPGACDMYRCFLGS